MTMWRIPWRHHMTESSRNILIISIWWGGRKMLSLSCTSALYYFPFSATRNNIYIPFNYYILYVQLSNVSSTNLVYNLFQFGSKLLKCFVSRPLRAFVVDTLSSACISKVILCKTILIFFSNDGRCYCFICLLYKEKYMAWVVLYIHVLRTHVASKIK